MNVVGAAGFIVNGWWHGALPSAALNVIWMLIGAVALWRIARQERLVDLSHVIEDGMTTYKGLPGPHICDYWTREASAANYDDGSTFQIGRIDMVANTGTYLDGPSTASPTAPTSPRCALESLADLAGLVVRSRSSTAGGRRRRLRRARRRAARRCWSTPAGTGTGAPTPISTNHPFLTAAAARLLVERGAAWSASTATISTTRAPARARSTPSCSAPASRSASI